jgi:hypothetical protein
LYGLLFMSKYSLHKKKKKKKKKLSLAFLKLGIRAFAKWDLRLTALDFSITSIQSKSK